MSSCFNISFTLNGVFAGNMFVAENMKFCEVVKNFSDQLSLKKENEATFFFNSKEIKTDSVKTLKELGISNMSLIEVKTKTPINNPYSQKGMNSFQPMGYMGLSPMGYMGMNNFMNEMNEEVINIKFNYSGSSFQIQARKNESFSNISQKFCMKAGIRNNEFPTYFLGSRKIDSNDNQTLSQLYIHNNSEISVLLSSEGNEKYINLIFCYQGKIVNIQESSKAKFSDLSRKFCNKAGMIDERPVYIFRSNPIHFDDTRTLEQIGLQNQMKIEVVIPTQVIGA
jgi:hypothetical protein